MTAKQRAFAQEYLIDLNATQAEFRAGYSERTAHSIGPRLLENVEVKREIEEQLDRIHSHRTATAPYWDEEEFQRWLEGESQRIRTGTVTDGANRGIINTRKMTKIRADGTVSCPMDERRYRTMKERLESRNGCPVVAVQGMTSVFCGQSERRQSPMNTESCIWVISRVCPPFLNRSFTLLKFRNTEV